MSVALLPAIKQLQLLRGRSISPIELAQEYIARMTRLNPVLNALVDFDAERVLRQASHVKDGRLSGLPVTVKSSISTSGYLCEVGSLINARSRADHDAAAVSALRREGAVILGTTNCPEFLMAYETDNVLHGRTNNPWSLEHTAGGSSGGEAAAVAAGISAGGIGSDSGGSVREPAHFSGICALKPTSGRISPAGHLPPCVGPFSTMGALGPMARTIDDVELLFSVLATPARSNESLYRPVSLEEARQVTIGWFEDDGITPVTQETRQAMIRAVEVLRANGFRTKQFRPAGLEEARRLWTIFFVQCGAMFCEPLIAGRHSELSPTFKNFLQIADAHGPLTAETLLKAWAEMDVVRASFQAEMNEYSVLLLPVAAIPAFRHGERQWDIDGSKVVYLDAMRYTQWFNLLDSPAAVVPVTSSFDGLPIGVQVAGRRFEDELVLAVAHVLDREFGYKKPPIA